MSGNEFLDKEKLQKKEAVLAKKKAKKEARKKKTESRRSFVKIMNGEFLSADNFVKNLPFIFFLGFLLVVVIGWGYYAETMTKKEVKLQRELGELDSEFFTLSSEFNSQQGRQLLEQRLNVEQGERLSAPKKIRIKKYVFTGER